ncbi:unnamed protein product [Rotaria sordida]|uniref:Uncharacterized protein n=1 Tax=Rotaria sordida TaxID=392033 RepID=A0A818V7L0_9BILA|nr:unnamed protein product [Rotaria sordida]
MYPPALEEFSFITDNTYETKHILGIEQIIMKDKENKITTDFGSGGKFLYTSIFIENSPTASGKRENVTRKMYTAAKRVNDGSLNRTVLADPRSNKTASQTA